jgi:hypothetical protein
VLGPTLHFKGELYGEEDLEFQGQIEGSIEHTAFVEHRQGRRREGQHPRQVRHLEGTVEGDVYATESVSIRQTAKVNGNIFAPARRHRRWRPLHRGRIDMNHKGVSRQGDRTPLTRRAAGSALAAGLNRLSGRKLLHDSSRKARAGYSCAPSAPLFDSSTTAQLRLR